MHIERSRYNISFFRINEITVRPEPGSRLVWESKLEFGLGRGQKEIISKGWPQGNFLFVRINPIHFLSRYKKEKKNIAGDELKTLSVLTFSSLSRDVTPTGYYLLAVIFGHIAVYTTVYGRYLLSPFFTTCIMFVYSRYFREYFIIILNRPFPHLRNNGHLISSQKNGCVRRKRV